MGEGRGCVGKPLHCSHGAAAAGGMLRAQALSGVQLWPALHIAAGSTASTCDFCFNKEVASLKLHGIHNHRSAENSESLSLHAYSNRTCLTLYVCETTEMQGMVFPFCLMLSHSISLLFYSHRYLQVAKRRRNLQEV